MRPQPGRELKLKVHLLVLLLSHAAALAASEEGHRRWRPACKLCLLLTASDTLDSLPHSVSFPIYVPPLTPHPPPPTHSAGQLSNMHGATTRHVRPPLYSPRPTLQPAL